MTPDPGEETAALEPPAPSLPPAPAAIPTPAPPPEATPTRQPETELDRAVAKLDPSIRSFVLEELRGEFLDLVEYNPDDLL